MSREERVDGRTVYEGRILRLEVDRVRRADGLEAEREVVRHRGVAVVLAVDADERVVLVRQYRYPVDRFVLELPAGTFDPGEEPLACAVRELAEETGCRAARWRSLGALWAAPGFTDERIFAFLASGLEDGDAAPDPDEDLEVVRLPLPEVAERVRRGEIADGKSVGALLLAQLHGELGHWW